MPKTAPVNEQPLQHLLFLLEAQGALEQAEELRGELFGPMEFLAGAGGRAWPVGHPYPRPTPALRSAAGSL